MAHGAFGTRKRHGLTQILGLICENPCRFRVNPCSIESYDMIQITPLTAIDESDITLDFVRSSGAGGQNVNKVSTAVQLRFDVAHSALPDDLKERLAKLAGKRLTQDGILILKAQSHRTQERNRQDAMERLAELIAQAEVRPTIRRPTRPTRASQRRRLESKRRRSEIKQARGSIPDE